MANQIFDIQEKIIPTWDVTPSQIKKLKCEIKNIVVDNFGGWSSDLENNL